MNYDIEVIGDYSVITGFSLTGVNKLVDKKGKELAKYIEEMIKNKEKKIIILQNEYFDSLPSRVQLKVITSINPLFIVLGRKSSDDLSLMVKRVFGVDLLNTKNNNSK